MPVEILKVGQLGTNCYFFWENETRLCFIIDPGDDGDFIANKLAYWDLKPLAIMTTHGHFDHVLAATELKLAYKIPFWMSKKDLSILKRACKTALFFTRVRPDPPANVDKYLKNNDLLNIKKAKLKVLSAPGHTPGGLIFYCKEEKLAFVGDTIFANGGYGRTDLAGGDFEKLKESIKKILELPDVTVLYPGHGKETTVEKESRFHK